MNLVTETLAGTTQDAIMDEMIALLVQEGRIKDPSIFKTAILAREAEGSTGIGMDVAIPHAKSDTVIEPTVVFGRSTGVDWDSADGTPAKLIFMIAVPTAQGGDLHLKILQMLSRKLMDDNFRENLLNEPTKAGIYQLLETVSASS